MSSARGIVLRGPNLLREDWNDSIATADAFIAGWFRSRDVDDREEGFFYVDIVHFDGAKRTPKARRDADSCRHVGK